MDDLLTAAFEAELLRKTELVRPGFTRVNLSFFASDHEIDYVLQAYFSPLLLLLSFSVLLFTGHSLHRIAWLEAAPSV